MQDSKSSNMKVIGFFVGGLILGILGTAGVMLAQKAKKAVDLSANLGKPFVTVDGKTWETGTLPGDASMDYFTLQNNIYNAEKNFAAQTALRIALANDASKTVSANELPKIDELLSIPPVSETEAKQYYEKVVAQMGVGVFGGQTFDKIKTQLQMQMSQQKASEIVLRKIQELEAGGRIKVLLNPPTSPSVKLELDAYPARGNKNADLVFVEVADYLCAHCRESEPIIEKLVKEFSNKIKFVHVSYPLAPQGLSGALAKGAYCATKQGEKAFWDYHNIAFQVPFAKANPNVPDAAKVFTDEAIAVAKQSNLDTKLFTDCMDSSESNEYMQKVQSQFNNSTGFKGTPTFYLNGKILEANPQQLEASIRAALK